MSLKRRFFAAIATFAMVGTMVIANAGVSEASTIYRFRLSQFSAAIANVCVYTDAAPDGVCTGNWPVGKSEIFDVPANSLDNWYCIAYVMSWYAPAKTGNFSRNDIKECALQGTASNYWIETKAP